MKLVDLATSLVGDYNGDQVVDAADYTVWRDTLGDSITPGEGADGNNNGIIDSGDYDFWRTNYGMTAVPGPSATSVAAPEPSAALLLLCALSVAGIGVRSKKG